MVVTRHLGETAVETADPAFETTSRSDNFSDHHFAAVLWQPRPGVFDNKRGRFSTVFLSIKPGVFKEMMEECPTVFLVATTRCF